MKKSKKLLLIFTIVMVLVSFQIVYADINYNNICVNEDILQVFKIIGYVLNTVKILVPLILIVVGMIDFGKAVISSDEKALSKATSSLVKRFISGIIIFFIPTIVFALLNFTKITNENDGNGSFFLCTKCLLRPRTCQDATGEVEGTKPSTGTGAGSGSGPNSDVDQVIK